MKKVIGRIIFVIPAIVLQVAWFFFFLRTLNGLFFGHLGDLLHVLFSILGVIFVVTLIGRREESTYKMMWIIVIVALPILGAMLYFMLGHKSTGVKLKKKLDKSAGELADAEILGSQESTAACIEEIKNDDLRFGQTIERVSEATGFPVLKNDTSKYYSFGEEMFPDMCADLEKAKKYIFVEYFIIQDGVFWDKLSGIMAEKVKEGVDVRVMYDDLGSIGTYSITNVKALQKKGIKCIPFNPFFTISSQLNNRDHRKIMVIDGEVAYSGGVNLADEYINEIHPFGVWKDLGIRITGAAVRSYAYMFAEFWNAFSNDVIHLNLYKEKSSELSIPETTDGYILPYYDSPMRNDPTSNELFTEMLSTAKDYAYFYTPYLMLGDALFDAFIRAAKRGLDVRLILPGIPDKKLVFRLATTYFEDLLKAGVKIYEYDPGFVHAKASIADDKIGTIGTVNLDYRSLFLHFECNSLYYKADILKDLKADFLKTQEECHEVTLESLNTKRMHKFVDNLLRAIAPLL